MDPTAATRGRGRRGRATRSRGRGRGRTPIPADTPQPSPQESNTPPIVDASVAQASPQIPAMQAQPAPVPFLPEEFVSFIRHVVQTTPVAQASAAAPAPQSTSIERIQRMLQLASTVGAKNFSGTEDPYEAEEWIATMEKVFELTSSLPEDRVPFISFLLKGDAETWWMSHKRHLGGHVVVDWDYFTQRFRKQYVPAAFRKEKLLEFMALRQTEMMTVDDYKRQFERLERFATRASLTVEERARRFHDGLYGLILGRMTHIDDEEADYDTILSAALKAESALKAERACQLLSTGKRDYPASSHGGGQPQEKKHIDSSLRSQTTRGGGQQPSSYPTGSSTGSKKGPPRPDCDKCGKPHLGECLKGEKICFECKQPGHFKRQCPVWQAKRRGSSASRGGQHLATPQGGQQQSEGRGNASLGRNTSQPATAPATARVFALTREEARADTEVITGEDS